MVNTVTVDLGVVCVEAKSDDASMGEVSDEVDDKLDRVEPMIEELKRMDYRLVEEYEDEEEILSEDPTRTFG